MAISPSDIKFYYTSSSSGLLTANANASSGGYPSGIEVVFNSIFDNDLSELSAQYRCIAIKNTNVSPASNVKIFLKDAGNNPFCSIRLSVERPYNDALSGVVAGGDTISLTDPAALVSVDENKYIGSMLEISTGETRRIVSFDPASSTVTVSNSYSSAVLTPSPYIIHPSPSQRTTTGMIEPSSVRRTIWSSPDSYESGISINVGGERDHGSSLMQHDVVYLWIERSFSKNAPAFDNNSISLSFCYTA